MVHSNSIQVRLVRREGPLMSYPEYHLPNSSFGPAEEKTRIRCVPGDRFSVEVDVRCFDWDTASAIQICCEVDGRPNSRIQYIHAKSDRDRCDFWRESLCLNGKIGNHCLAFGRLSHGNSHVSQSGDAAGGRLDQRGSVVVVVTRGEHQISSQDADGCRIEESFRPAQGEVGRPIRLVVYYDSCREFGSFKSDDGDSGCGLCPLDLPIYVPEPAKRPPPTAIATFLQPLV